MEIIGTITKVLPIESGVSKTGNAWQRQTVIISYGDGQYAKELALSLMNKRIDECASMLRPNAQLKFYFDPSSREYNGRWYTECMAWKVEQAGAVQGFNPNNGFPNNGFNNNSFNPGGRTF